ncbi:MAG: hypothetical protein IKV59_08930 [Lachnospiraceae bacterium]|nr:hypothetical protein [Lachnospiraceae bacterium]
MNYEVDSMGKSDEQFDDDMFFSYIDMFYMDSLINAEPDEAKREQMKMRKKDILENNRKIES